MAGIVRVSEWDEELVVLRSEVEGWRQQKKRVSEAMPTPLWKAAVRLAMEGSVGEVARYLGVDHGKLAWLVREQVSHGGGEVADLGVHSEFVELGELLGEYRAVVEMHREGTSLRVELPGEQVNLMELATCFFGRIG